MNTEDTELAVLPIREAADRYGLTTAALRHYGDIGLVVPAGRLHGQRVYGREQLRRLALVALCRRLGLGLGLEVAVALLDSDHYTRRSTGSAHLEDLRAQIARAQAAISFLEIAASCRHDQPARDCPDLIEALDRLASRRRGHRGPGRYTRHDNARATPAAPGRPRPRIDHGSVTGAYLMPCARSLAAIAKRISTRPASTTSDLTPSVARNEP